jgi:hypothetical protein
MNKFLKLLLGTIFQIYATLPRRSMKPRPTESPEPQERFAERIATC